MEARGGVVHQGRVEVAAVTAWVMGSLHVLIINSPLLWFLLPWTRRPNHFSFGP